MTQKAKFARSSRTLTSGPPVYPNGQENPSICTTGAANGQLRGTNRARPRGNKTLPVSKHAGIKYFACRRQALDRTGTEPISTRVCGSSVVPWTGVWKKMGRCRVRAVGFSVNDSKTNDPPLFIQGRGVQTSSRPL